MRIPPKDIQLTPFEKDLRDLYKLTPFEERIRSLCCHDFASAGLPDNNEVREISAEVMKLAKKDIENKLSLCGRRGRQGGIPEDISKAANEYQATIEGPYDSDDICSAYEQGCVDTLKKIHDNIGNFSDGYHTFDELYYYRLLYNAAFFNSLPKRKVHKSKRHYTGEECFGGGWFIVMAELPTGQISNHYEMKYWDLFHVPEREIAAPWDGHTPQEAAERLRKYLSQEQ